MEDTGGVAPKAHLVSALADYQLPGDGFLPLREGDVIHVVETDASGWWLGVNTAGKKGVLPSTYTEPHVFSYPSDDIMEEVHKLRLAKEYGVDLTSGVALPTAKMRHLSVGEQRRHWQVNTVDELYKVVDDEIIEREQERCHFVTALQSLLKSLEVTEANSATEASLDEMMSAMKEKTKQLEQSIAALATGALKDKDDHLGLLPERATQGRFLGVPSRSWYAEMETALGTTDGAAELVSAFDRAAELGDVRTAVQRHEQALGDLSATLRARETQYREGKALLVQRVDRRDRAVTRLLAWWAEKADQARSDYLAVKAERLRSVEVAQRELTALKDALDLKRHAFSTLAQQLEEATITAKQLKTKLASKDELVSVDAEISKVNAAFEELRNARREAKHRKRRAATRKENAA